MIAPRTVPQAALRLKPGREKSLLRRHPWVFASAIAGVEGQPAAGETVKVCDSTGGFLAWAGYSPTSQITARVWSWQQSETINEEFFRHRLATAIEARRRPATDDTPSACRLAHAESDGLPGVIVDRYGSTLVLQALTAGAERWREVIAQAALEVSGASAVYERSDADVRQLEGLAERAGWMLGAGGQTQIEIEENGLRFGVDIAGGHKTGFYLDQRVNRARLREWAGRCEVLDCFCYSGGFTLSALAGGAAAVTAVDASAGALSSARQNLTRNGFPAESATWLEGDVFHILRQMRDRGRVFDLIILDPPKFAPTVTQAERAARGYKDINLLAFKLLRPGGRLVTFSCSGGVNTELFQKIVAGAALDAGVDAQIHEYLHQSPDHPVALSFPEGAYLKGLAVTARPWG